MTPQEKIVHGILTEAGLKDDESPIVVMIKACVKSGYDAGLAGYGQGYRLDRVEQKLESAIDLLRNVELWLERNLGELEDSDGGNALAASIDEFLESYRRTS